MMPVAGAWVAAGAAAVDNPGAGRSDYRQSETFFHQCRQLRALIREHCDAV